MLEQAPTEVSLPRIYALRAAYGLLVVGLGPDVWTGLVFRDSPPALMDGVVESILAAVSVLALLGVRYPLQMLPLLFFETIWKAVWLAFVALPQHLEAGLDPDAAHVAFACALGVIFPLVIPWRYVLDGYVRRPGQRWR